MLITGKKRPFCFVLKQEKPLNRGEKGVFHIKTLCVGGEGEASPCLQPCPSVTLERSDRVQGKSSVTPSCGRSPPRNAPAPLQKKRRGRAQRILSIGMSSFRMKSEVNCPLYNELINCNHGTFQKFHLFLSFQK